MTLTSKDLARPSGVPLVENKHEPKKNPLLVTFTKWQVGGQSVKLDEQTELLHIGEDTLSAPDWVKLRGRIDRTFMHINTVKKGPEPNKSRPASDFLNANLHLINSIKRGKIKKNWLTRLFGWMGVDWVITNEELTPEDSW